MKTHQINNEGDLKAYLAINGNRKTYEITYSGFHFVKESAKKVNGRLTNLSRLHKWGEIHLS